MWVSMRTTVVVTLLGTATSLVLTLSQHMRFRGLPSEKGIFGFDPVYDVFQWNDSYLSGVKGLVV